MSKLVNYVYIEGPDGMAAFGPDDDVPEWAARKMGAHCFEDGEHPYPAGKEDDGDPPPDPGQEPPRAGKGSSREAWAVFASEHDVKVEDDENRDAIVAKLVDREVIQP